ncbi:hypothetical protein DFH07DRAFT_776408 [Mycena maculata]|uniref:Uncharacterized protein n=1 Tax=Mycena maculata TaxID=230809 RepID=A0AAD7N5A0_9AGAR|nr:hypothetical protein DFH07DRAFT_776408 [Mycena maculata]
MHIQSLVACSGKSDVCRRRSPEFLKQGEKPLRIFRPVPGKKTLEKIASPAMGNEKYVQAHFSTKRANGLANGLKPTNELASRNAGLGLGATPNPSPSPINPVCAGVAENLTLRKTTKLFTSPFV